MKLDKLKARAAKDPRFAPRFHAGIGMIQLFLTSKKDRLHIWHPEQEATRPHSDIHNHKFSFSSRILKGELLHEVIYVMEGGELKLWRTHQDAGADAELVGNVGIVVGERRFLKKGDEYFFEAGRFHRSQAIGLTITRMQKFW